MAVECPSCKRDNPSGSGFCLGCGATLARSCMGCGQELPPDAGFCNVCGQRLDVAQPEAPQRAAAPAPSSFGSGRYRVERFLGEGAKKRVYLARDTRLDRDVAILVIKREGLDAEGRLRVQREAQSMGRLGDHPHIVTVHDVAEEGDDLFIVSQYMAGGDLETRLAEAEEHRLPIEETLAVGTQLCQALEHAHSRRVIHRDLKPGNVYLAEDGTAKLGDFGLAVALDRSRLTQAGMIVGTGAYMPPEQALGRPAEARSDLYSLGAMLYEMVTGCPPFLGDDAVAIIFQHINTPPVAPSWHIPKVSRALEALILRLLSKAPEERPESAAAVSQALAAISPVPSAAAEPTAEEEVNPLDRLAGGVFVGREREMDELRAGVEEALSGHGRLLLLVGEPGIGKTRTSEELATYARLRNAQVLWGRCYEGEGAPAYWPWVQVIRSYVHDRDPKELFTEMGPGAADIAQVVSEVRERLPGLPTPAALEPEQARFRLHDSITTFLKNASNRAPLLLILDDLHWADKPSLVLLQFLARELRGTRLLVLGTYRDVELGRQHPLAQTLGELARAQQGQRVLLRGLGERDVALFIERTAAIKPPEALVRAVYRETEGNPFFVNEIVRLLVADGRLENPEQVRSWSVSIPQGVREVVGRRLDHLSEPCNRVLTVASVIGREFDLKALGPVSGVAGDKLLEVVEEAVAARVVAELPRAAGRYSFSHTLIRETLYEELGTTRRLRLHRRVAEVLEDLYRDRLEPHLAELAYHLCEAAPLGDVERAIDYATRAAKRAMDLLAYEEAPGLYERALQALEVEDSPDRGRRCELLLSLAEAQHAAGEHVPATETSEAAADLARALGKPELLARAALVFGDARWVVQAPPETTIALLEEALNAFGEQETPLRARLLSLLAMASSWLADGRSDSVSREALAIARRVGDPETLLSALFARHAALRVPDTVEERLEIANELLRVGEEAELGGEAIVGGHEARMIGLLELGDAEGADRAIEAATQAGEESRQAWLIAVTQGYRGLRALLHGRFEECERLALEAQATGQRLQSGHVTTNAGIQILGLRLAQGRLEETLEGVEAFVGQGPLSRITLALWYAELGRAEEARRQFERVAAGDFRNLPRDALWLPNMALFARVCALLGDARRAELLYDLLGPYAARNAVLSSALCLGSVSHCLGLLAATASRLDDAARHFEDALEGNAALGARAHVAETQYNYSRALLDRGGPGDRKRALELVNLALDTAQELGMKLVVERALALKLELQGIDPADTKRSVYAVTSAVHRDQPDLTPQAAPDGTVTLMFSDMEGFTEMTERLGDLRAREVIREHNRIVRAELAAHDGYEVELQGDGFLLAFGSARRALACAVAIQRAFAAHNDDHSDEPIRVRIGLHTGEALKDADKFFGKTVILTSRIAARAQGGEVLVSALLKGLVESAGDVRFGKAQEVDLKGISERQWVFQVDWR